MEFWKNFTFSAAFFTAFFIFVAGAQYVVTHYGPVAFLVIFCALICAVFAATHARDARP